MPSLVEQARAASTLLGAATAKRATALVLAAVLSAATVAVATPAPAVAAPPPGAVDPGALGPGLPGPGVLGPNALGPNALGPGAAGPNAGAPNAAVPNAGAPNAAVPNAAVPNAAVPNAAVPNAAVPNAAVPGAPAVGAAAADAAAAGPAQPVNPGGPPPVMVAPGGAAPAAAAPPAAGPAAVTGGGGWANAGRGAAPGPGAPSVAAPAGYPVTGIDVSSNDHTGGRTIDWAGQARAGVKFAYVKATEGTGYVNPYFDSDYHAAKNQGIFVGAYHFARPDLGNPVGQADALVNTAQYANDGLTLVPFLDIEWPYATLGLPDCWGLSTAQMSAWIGAFVNEVQARIGKPPMIYTNSNWWNPCTGNNATFGYLPLDVAAYTTSPPVLPAGWNRFTIWQYSAGPWPGDKDVFNGSLAELAAFAGVSTVPLTPHYDSIVARTPQGNLVVYPNVHGRGVNTFGPPTVVGLGWNGMEPIDAADVNGDGFDDILARDGLGRLWVYYDRRGTGTTLFSPPVLVGLGWGGMNSIQLGDVTGDHRADIVARDGLGRLWLYPSAGGTGTTTFGGPALVGIGWQVMNLIRLGDMNSDGKADLVARDSSGNLWMYPRAGGANAGTFSGPIELGVGWNVVNSISLGDVNGDGRTDLVARDNSGLLWLYPNSGGAGVYTLAGPSELGFGWGAMTALDLGSF